MHAPSISSLIPITDYTKQLVNDRDINLSARRSLLMSRLCLTTAICSSQSI